jgi:hydrogenase maturation protein HypF
LGLFDSVAALIGVRHEVNYEAQAAIELEALADPSETACYHFELRFPDSVNQPYRIDPAPAFHEIVKDLRNQVPVARISTRFHRAAARAVVDTLMAANLPENQVALSGGVWQNHLLLNFTLGDLQEQGFQVLLHYQVPCNDGGVSLGQAAIASWRLDKGLIS